MNTAMERDGAATAGEAPHILVVDDDERLRRLLRKYLTDNGYMVSTAADAGEARAQMAALAFDLLVLDVMMPGESGLDLTRALRTEGVSVPILMLTAMGETEDRINGLAGGADDYLAKPLSRASFCCASLPSCAVPRRRRGRIRQGRTWRWRERLCALVASAMIARARNSPATASAFTSPAPKRPCCGPWRIIRGQFSAVTISRP